MAVSMTDRLNQDLIEYLSPWFYDAAREAKDGGYVSEDCIAEFIVTRPYVASLDSITLHDTPDPASPNFESDWYFLTSAHTHDITDVNTDNRCEDDEQRKQPGYY